MILVRIAPEIVDEPLLNWHSELEAVYGVEEMKQRFSFCLLLPRSDEVSLADIPKIRNSVSSSRMSRQR